jgi:DNA-binding MarR family transcriptional regulator
LLNARYRNEAASELTRVTSLNLEELLTSRSRIKILKALATRGSLNISGIRKCTGLNYKSIARALDALKHMRVIGEIRLDGTRSFRIRVENEQASKIDRLIKTLESLEGEPIENAGKSMPPSGYRRATHNKI